MRWKEYGHQQMGCFHSWLSSIIFLAERVKRFLLTYQHYHYWILHQRNFGKRFLLQVVPWGLRNTLNWIKKEYGNIPVLITENGYADYGEIDDRDRVKSIVVSGTARISHRNPTGSCYIIAKLTVQMSTAVTLFYQITRIIWQIMISADSINRVWLECQKAVYQ